MRVRSVVLHSLFALHTGQAGWDLALPLAPAVPAAETMPRCSSPGWLMQAVGAPRGDLPADPWAGNTHPAGADEQLQMCWGEEALAEGWKGHVHSLWSAAWLGMGGCLCLSKPPDDYPWTGWKCWDNQACIKRKRQETLEVKLLDLRYVGTNTSPCYAESKDMCPSSSFWPWSLVNLWPKHLSLAAWN